MEASEKSASEPVLVEKSQAKMSKGTTSVLLERVHTNFTIAAVDLSHNTDNSTSVLEEIENFYSNNEIDINVAIALQLTCLILF